MRYQFRFGAGAWIDVCNATSAPFTCSADTAGVPDGVYDVRAIATDGVGLATTSATLSLRVDNTAPSSVALTDPGSPLSGSVTLTATAVDAGSGIASVRIERAPAGGSTWTEVCTDTAAPYSCAWSDADGLYDLRAVATDVAGNTRTSAVVANRRLDTAGPAVTLTDPGSPLRGSVTLNATAIDPAGVASVTFQRKSSSGSTWATICTDNAAPYTCAWLTSAGAYDLRATALDTLGRSTNSAVVASRQVDNTAPVASAVSAVNGSGTLGRIDAGDVLTFTYSEAMAAGSILAGWNGAAINVNVRVTASGSNDRLSIWDAANTTQLAIAGDLQLSADKTTAGARLAGTAVLSGSQVVVTVGALASGSVRTAATTTAMIWTPVTTATDLAGNAVSSAALTEANPADVDF